MRERGAVTIRPGTVLAMLALFVAMGGAAFAAAKIDTRDLATASVTAKKLANKSVRANKIADGAVINSKLAAGSVTTDKLADGAVTGPKVNESTLDEVPSAASAGNASTTDGMSLAKFSATPPANTQLALLTTIGSLDILVGCGALNKPLLSVRPANGAPPQTLRFAVIFDDGPVDTESTKTGGQGTLPAVGQSILEGDEPEIGTSGSIDAVTTAGVVTTINFSARAAFNAVPSPNPEPNNCTIYGTAVTG